MTPMIAWELSHTTASFIHKNVCTVVPVKCCKTYTNNKRWVSKQIKEVVKRRVYFKGGWRGQGGVTQSKVKRKIKKATEAYKDKTKATHTTGKKNCVCVCVCVCVLLLL